MEEIKTTIFKGQNGNEFEMRGTSTPQEDGLGLIAPGYIITPAGKVVIIGKESHKKILNEYINNYTNINTNNEDLSLPDCMLRLNAMGHILYFGGSSFDEGVRASQNLVENYNDSRYLPKMDDNYNPKGDLEVAPYNFTFPDQMTKVQKEVVDYFVSANKSFITGKPFLPIKYSVLFPAPANSSAKFGYKELTYDQYFSNSIKCEEEPFHLHTK